MGVLVSAELQLATVCLEGIDNVFRTLRSHPSQESLLPLQKQIAQFLKDNDYLQFLATVDNAPDTFMSKGQILVDHCEVLLSEADEVEDLHNE